MLGRPAARVPVRVVAFDLETHLIAPGVLAPPIVCASLAWRDGPGGPNEVAILLDGDDDEGPAPVVRTPAPWEYTALVDADQALRVARALLSAPDVLLVGANVTYDLACLCADDPTLVPLVFAALRENRVSDVQIRERLIALSTGALHETRVGLADLTLRYVSEAAGLQAKANKAPRGRKTGALAGDDAPAPDDADPWRLRYAELDGVPLADWPEAAVQYPLDDANNTLLVWEAQNEGPTMVGGFPLRRPSGRIVSEEGETRAAWALHLAATWGLRATPAAVDRALATWAAAEALSLDAAREGGWYRPEYVGPRGGSRPAGITTAVLRTAIEDAWGPPSTWDDEGPALTEKGAISTSEDALLAAADRPGAPEALRRYAAGLQARKRLAVWGPALQSATTRPLTSRPIHLVATGRTAWSGPPLQQPPKDGGVRDCFEPRPGTVYVGADYSTAELCAVAQICLWQGFGRKLLDAINTGADIHCLLAANLDEAGRTPEVIRAAYKAGEKWADDLRQLGKIANFGLWGGLGPAKLAAHASKKLGRRVTVEEASALRDAWRRTWPENRAYFAALERPDGVTLTVQQYGSGRIRGGCHYTDGANTQFQGFVADIAKDALWRVSHEAYTGTDAGDEAEGAPAGGAYGPSGALGTVSPLFLARPVLFLHDEIILEAPEESAPEAADRLAEVMVAAGRAYAPDVLWAAEPVVMGRWRKGARPVRDAAGRLVPVD